MGFSRKVEDNEILELLNEGLSKKEIAKKLKVSYSCISSRIKKLKKLGVEIYDKSREKDNIIVALLKEECYQAEIARKLGITREAVSQRMKKMEEQGVKIPKRKRNKKSKKPINDATDYKILELYEKEFPQGKIAKELGISYNTVHRRMSKMEAQGLVEKRVIKPKKTENDEKDNKILKLLEEGFKQIEIAKEMGVSVGAVSHRVTRMKKRGEVIPKNIGKRASIFKTVESKKNSEFKKDKMERTKIDYAKEIVKLMDTKKASVDQVRTMARIYGVDEEVEKLLNSLDEKDR